MNNLGKLYCCFTGSLRITLNADHYSHFTDKKNWFNYTKLLVQKYVVVSSEKIKIQFSQLQLKNLCSFYQCFLQCHELCLIFNAVRAKFQCN